MIDAAVPRGADRTPLPATAVGGESNEWPGW